MPYLTEDDRAKLDEHIDGLLESLLGDVSVPGGLNYAICRVADGITAANGECYALYNTLLGAVEAAKLEIYRRMVAPYEDSKKVSNGEVFMTPEDGISSIPLRLHSGQLHGGA